MRSLEDLAQSLQLDLELNPPRQVNHHKNTIEKDGEPFSFETDAILKLVDPQNVGDVKKAGERLARICRWAADNAWTMRAAGSRWSFSDCPAPGSELRSAQSILVETQNFAQQFGHPSVASLRYLTSGAQLHRVNVTLEAQRRNIRTSGSSDGQTIAGAIGTGVHGSAFKIGAIHDSVHAFHIAMPEGHFLVVREEDHRFSRDVLQYFATAVDARLRPDTKLFRALQVSFGSFGVLIGVVLDTDVHYGLRVVRKRFPPDHLELLLDLMEDNLQDHPQRSFSELRPIDPAFAPEDPADAPHHCQLLFNPYDRETYRLILMYRRDHFEPPEHFEWPDGFSEFWVKVVQSIWDHLDELDALFEPLVSQQFNALTDVDGWGRRSEIFGAPNQPLPVHSVGIGIPFRETARALNIAHDLVAHEKQPGTGELRFVKASDAYLAINRFAPITAVIGFDGLDISDAWEFSRSYFEELRRAQIPFRVHWGKMNDLAHAGVDTAARVAEMYGPDLVDWKSARNAFLGDAQPTFDNAFVRRLHLDRAG